MNIVPVNIREHINTDFKSYAIYVIQSRGIPNFYDSFTPVQRLILQNAPDKFQATLALVGQVLATGEYAHGDNSLGSAINKLARPFGCAKKILLGDGFFGSPVKPKAASPRYTKVKIDPDTKEIISKYNVLNNSDTEWLYVDVPLGLSTHIVGIAVGYSTNMLPRKIEDITAYLNGKSKKLLPHFEGFNGNIKKFPGRDSGWIFEGLFTATDNNMTVHIKDLPPLIKYTTFVDNLNKKLSAIGKYKLLNNSKTTVDITIKWSDRDTWNHIKEIIEKLTKVIAIEQFIFIKNGTVVEYKTIFDYLDEFKLHRERVIHMKMVYDKVEFNNELEFLYAKKEFLLYMLETKRTAADIKKFINRYKSPDIKRRLDIIKLTALSMDTVKQIDAEITSTIKDITEQEIKIDAQLNKCVQLETGFVSRGKISMGNALFEEELPYQVDGIEVFEQDLDEEEESIDEDN